MLLPHALALSASQFVHKKKSLRMYASVRSGGLELTPFSYSRHEDNLLHTTGATGWRYVRVVVFPPHLLRFLFSVVQFFFSVCTVICPHVGRVFFAASRQVFSCSSPLPAMKR